MKDAGMKEGIGIMLHSELLYYGGLLLLGIAAVGAIVAALYFHRAKKHLQAQLLLEYGGRRA